MLTITKSRYNSLLKLSIQDLEIGISEGSVTSEERSILLGMVDYKVVSNADEIAKKAKEQEAAVMEAEVASEGRAAKPKKAKAKKTDKRKSPEFIKHLRNLAQKRKEEAAKKRAKIEAKAKSLVKAGKKVQQKKSA